MLLKRVLCLGFAASLLGLTGCDSDDSAGGCPTGQGMVKGQCVSFTSVRLNTIGFLPDRPKLATVMKAATTFDVVNSTGAVVYSGTVTGPVTNSDTSEDVYLADFSEFTDEGEYHIEVPKVGRSPDFKIAADLYVQPIQVAMTGLTLARCGTAVKVTLDDTTYAHGECHMKDARLDYLEPGNATIRKSLLGWHDAGDYGKYTINGAFSAGIVLMAWEHFGDKLAKIPFTQIPADGDLPPVLAEVKYELDWLFTVQEPDGSVSHKVTALGFEGFVSPEADFSPRFYTSIGTAATADFAAVMAQAARVYKDYDANYAAKCLDAAKLAYQFLTDHPTDIQPDQTDFSTGTYNGQDPNHRIWAAAEFWATTGDAAALADFETKVGALPQNWDWSDPRSIGYFTYALATQDGRTPDSLSAVQKSILATADGIAATSKAHGYGRGLKMYYWGSNGVSVRTTLNLMAAMKVLETQGQSPNNDYANAAIAQLDYILGRNYFARSFVTHLGFDPPVHPHHRPSVAGGRTWPGLMVGGPQNQNKTNADDTTGARTWNDSSDDYNTNEVAINWTAPLLYGMAAFLP